MTDNEKRTFYIVSSRVRDNALEAVNEADPGSIVSVSPPTRSLEQNAKLHAVLTDLARSPLTWAGKRRTVDEWKMLAVSAHAVATGKPGEVIPGLEGEFVAIRESTAVMSVGRASSLIEYLIAFCAQNNVELKETRKRGFLIIPGDSPHRVSSAPSPSTRANGQPGRHTVSAGPSKSMEHIR